MIDPKFRSINRLFIQSFKVSEKDRNYYEIVINPEYGGYQRRLASIVYKFFDKKTGSGASANESYHTY